MLELNGLHAGYSGLPVLFGVDLTVTAGEIVAILGPNGAGKSTLLKSIIGTVPATSGDIVFEQRRINGFPPYARVVAGISFSPEGRRVFGNLTTYENLVVGAQGVPTSELSAQADFVEDLFPILRERRAQRARTLSGGEQQMLSIGRALMARPRLLLIEEPSQGLAPLILDKVYDTLRRLSDWGIGVLVVEQFQKYRDGYADRVLELEKGLLVPPSGSGWDALDLYDPAAARTPDWG